jgi:hypothetical protein
MKCNGKTFMCLFFMYGRVSTYGARKESFLQASLSSSSLSKFFFAVESFFPIRPFFPLWMVDERLQTKTRNHPHGMKYTEESLKMYAPCRGLSDGGPYANEGRTISIERFHSIVSSLLYVSLTLGPVRLALRMRESPLEDVT